MSLCSNPTDSSADAQSLEGQMRRAKGAPAQQPPSQQAMALRCQTEALSLQSGDPVAVRRPFDGGKCLQAVSPGPKQEDQHHSFEFQENDRMYS